MFNVLQNWDVPTFVDTGLLLVIRLIHIKSMINCIYLWLFCFKYCFGISTINIYVSSICIYTTYVIILFERFLIPNFTFNLSNFLRNVCKILIFTKMIFNLLTFILHCFDQIEILTNDLMLALVVCLSIWFLNYSSIYSWNYNWKFKVIL